MTLTNIQNWLNVSRLNAQLIAFLGVLIFALLTFLIVKSIIVKIIWKIAKKTKTKWDDAIMERNVLQKFAYIFPFLIIHYFSYLFDNFQILIQKISLIFIVWFVLLTTNSFLNAINDIFKTHKISKKTSPKRLFTNNFNHFIFVW